ncbi:MAG: sugar transferase [Candidatus Omnitrophota bacterium]
MFRERIRFFIELDIVFDIILVALSFIVAIIAREGYLYGNVGVRELFMLFGQQAWILLIAYPFIMVSLFLGKAYGPLRFRPLHSISWMIIKSFIFTVVALAFILFIFKVQLVSRLFLVSFGVIGSCIFILKKFLEISFLQFFRQKGLNLKYIALAGQKDDFDNIINKIKQNPEYGLEIVALIKLGQDKSPNKSEDPRLYYGLEGLEAALKEKVIDYILFAGYKGMEDEIEKGLFICEEHGVETWLVTDFFHMNIAQQDIDDFFGMPVIIFRSSPQFSKAIVVKRLIDILVSAAVLVLCIPLFVLIALITKAESLGPAIFSQKRSGLNGRVFTLYKFRSMVSEAEQEKQELEKFNEMSGPVFKLTNDPRVTRFGRFLRRWSLDEFPQLINVLRGEMSLVGPRPLPVYEAEKLKGWQKRRLRMRPGLTCLWQIRGRSKVDFGKWMEYDLEYIDNWRLWLDFNILFKTIFVVFSSKGAY